MLACDAGLQDLGLSGSLSSAYRVRNTQASSFANRSFKGKGTTSPHGAMSTLDKHAHGHGGAHSHGLVPPSVAEMSAQGAHGDDGDSSMLGGAAKMDLDEDCCCGPPQAKGREAAVKMGCCGRLGAALCHAWRRMWWRIYIKVPWYWIADQADSQAHLLQGCGLL